MLDSDVDGVEPPFSMLQNVPFPSRLGLKGNLEGTLTTGKGLNEFGVIMKLRLDW